jgi:hypothetical protein
MLLCLVWTAYVFVGSHLKDRRLVHYTGDAYRSYQARVPGYPGMLVGPLGRVPLSSPSMPMPPHSILVPTGLLTRRDAASNVDAASRRVSQ